DEAFEGFNDDEGEPLFEGDETTQILQQAMDFLEEYQKQYVRTEAFVKRLKDNDLLMALNAKVDMVDGQQFGLTGLLAVDERKLLQLPDDKALELFRSGELSWLYCHLMSLGCMGRLIDRMGKRGPVSAEEKEEKAPEPKAKAKAKAKK
ncbi:MAG: peptidase, partial [Gammaproteobacteria bacterium]|nr:peptidase [Gammaproteobacteria bacterium]